MPTDPTIAQPTHPRPGRLARVEYLDFQSVPDYREYRLAVYGPGGAAEVRLRIATAAFGARGVRLQDGPDICYQRLLRALACGEASSPGVVTIDDLELASYREAHTQEPRRRSWTAPEPPKPPLVPRE
jgi:hypothetical protein